MMNSSMIKKEEREKRKTRSAVGIVLSFSLLFFLLFSLSSSVSLAQEDDEQAEQSLQLEVATLVNAFPLTKFAGGGADICIIIPSSDDPAKTHSYRALKADNETTVTPYPHSTYCENDPNNKGPQDFVIQYVDHESFLDHVQDPSCRNFKTSGAGEDFYYLPSKFMEAGGNPVCNEVFRQRYCPAVQQCLSNAEMKAHGLGCCSGGGILDALLSLFGSKQETPTQEMPGTLESLSSGRQGTGKTQGFFPVLALLLLALVLAGVCIITLVIVKKHHKKERPAGAAAPTTSVQATAATASVSVTPDLVNYIHNAVSLGYSREQIEAYLLQLGWEKEAIDAAYNQVLGRWLLSENPPGQQTL